MWRACRVERVLELAHIALNKNTVPGDKSAMVPGGIRMGSPALTSRGFVEQDFVQVAEFVHRGVSIAKALKAKAGAPPCPPPLARCLCSDDAAATRPWLGHLGAAL